MSRLAELTSTFPRTGRIEWIGLRGHRKSEMSVALEAEVTLAGLAGDHARPGKRALTLIQSEHLGVIAALSGLERLGPEILRRNVVVSSINLTALKGCELRLGTATIRLTTVCAPCSRMETALGEGGYNAMRGHGGYCAEVLVPGRIAIGDALDPVVDDQDLAKL
ncbi:MOSC domain-containing protein [Pontivivens insulae]|uniref:MOSC domain-containing protein n=1 Tax=Pontivivens insulae TaxID=1639689 RepID=A0A2R8AEQ0_9RHOB|nr:MOSC domain-containing protein [Pontivivens insulae]RED11967.1 hypothetical protein DFR53_2679 [Pontivivens insulae]SPF30723.1 hypothetical protein POI8812_03065 [Pontivivens insulae]